MSANRKNPYKTENSGRKQAIYIALILLLVLVNAFLFYSNYQSNNHSDALSKERDELLEQKIVFEKKIDSLKQSLEESLGLNEELDSMLQVRIVELTKMKANYSRLMAQKNKEVGELNRELKEKIREVERLKRQYEQELTEWREKYAILEEEKNILQDTLEGKQTRIRELNKKIDRGEILSAVNIDAYGVKIRGGSKEKRTDRARRTDKLKVCFHIATNRLADPGMKVVLLKITGPDGSTLAIQSQGSGSFNLAGSGEQSLYTKKLMIDYDPSDPEKEYCAEWPQENGFQTGTYRVDLYQEGYLIGTGSLELKKSGLF